MVVVVMDRGGELLRQSGWGGGGALVRNGEDPLAGGGAARCSTDRCLSPSPAALPRRRRRPRTPRRHPFPLLIPPFLRWRSPFPSYFPSFLSFPSLMARKLGKRAVDGVCRFRWMSVWCVFVMSVFMDDSSPLASLRRLCLLDQEAPWWSL